MKINIEGLMMNRILVTGGAGFIGSHLAHTIKDNFEVTIVDDLSLGTKDNIPDGVTFYHMPAGNIAFRDEKYDVVFHLGIPSSSPMYKENPYLVVRAVNDFQFILEYCRRNDAILVYASTSSLYNGNPVPYREDMPIHVTDFYTEARYYMERLAQLYNKLYGLSSIGLRFFSIYGERERHKGRYANLVSQFIWKMMKGEPPEIYGDGTQTRDFTYVGDVVMALFKAMRFMITHSNVCEIFNVGTGRSYSLNQLVELINDRLGTGIKPKYVPNPIKNYVQHTQADTAKAEAILGFKAKITLKEGINILKEASEG